MIHFLFQRLCLYIFLICSSNLRKECFVLDKRLNSIVTAFICLMLSVFYAKQGPSRREGLALLNEFLQLFFWGSKNKGILLKHKLHTQRLSAGGLQHSKKHPRCWLLKLRFEPEHTVGDTRTKRNYLDRHHFKYSKPYSSILFCQKLFSPHRQKLDETSLGTWQHEWRSLCKWKWKKQCLLSKV